MRNRYQAQLHFAELLEAEDSDFIIAYQDFFGKLHYLGCSPGLMRAVGSKVGTPLDRILAFSEGEITIGDRTLESTNLIQPWGLVILIDDEPSLKDQIEKMSDAGQILGALGGAMSSLGESVKGFLSGLKTLGGALLSAFLLFLSSITFLRDYIPLPSTTTKKAESVSEISRPSEILKEGYQQLPDWLIVNGFFWWGYGPDGGCLIRFQITGYSPALRDGVLKGIETRYTYEDGWVDVLEAHKQRKPHIVRRDTLSEGSPLKRVMAELGVRSVVTVPSSNYSGDCPKSYVSMGVLNQLAPDQEKDAIAELQKVADLLSEWERSQS